MNKLTLVLAACMLVVAGCGTEAPAPGAGVSAPTAAEGSTSPEVEAVTIEVTIADHEISPRDDRVDVQVGQPVRLVVDSDAADKLHVHSDPEHEFAVEAGQDQEFEFTVTRPGQVAVESHHTEATIAQLVVTP